MGDEQHKLVIPAAELSSWTVTPSLLSLASFLPQDPANLTINLSLQSL